MRKGALWAGIALLAALLVSCSDGDGVGFGTPEVGGPIPEGPTVCEEPPVVEGMPPDGNQFANPSFEEGSDPWCSLASRSWGTPFEVSSTRARTGDGAAFLQMRTTDETAQFASRVFGAVTEVAPEEFPEVLSGYYYVDSWDRQVQDQYLQAVVVVSGAENLTPAGFPNYQVRYVLGPIEYEPLEITNAQYVHLSPRLFAGGRWVGFEANVREDFERLWGAVPEDFDRIRVLFEVRWDDRRLLDGYASADVYYDDLYFGPADGAP